MSFDYDKSPKVLKDFLDYLRLKSYSFHTIKNYGLDLLCFFEFLKSYFKITIEVKNFSIFVLLRVKEADVIAFLVYLNFNRNNTARTRQRRLSCIRTFYRWLLSYCPVCNCRVNPAENILAVKGVVGVPKYLTLEQSKKIVNVFSLKNSLYPWRDNMIVFLFLNTGMRVSELCGLNVADIDFGEMFIQVVGKGDKERKIPMNENTKKQLLAYLKLRNRWMLKVEDEGALFVGHRKGRLGVSGVEDVCRKAFGLMNLQRCGFSAHTLRHTAATILYQYAGADVLLLKEFLGHDSMEATQIYTHVYDEKIKSAMDCNPLSDFFERVA